MLIVSKLFFLFSFYNEVVVILSCNSKPPAPSYHVYVNGSEAPVRGVNAPEDAEAEDNSVIIISSTTVGLILVLSAVVVIVLWKKEIICSTSKPPPPVEMEENRKVTQMKQDSEAAYINQSEAPSDYINEDDEDYYTCV